MQAAFGPSCGLNACASLTVGSRIGPRSPEYHRAVSEPTAYFITFTCYGERLHGDERGSVERRRDGTGVDAIPASPFRERYEASALVGGRVLLDEPRREAVAAVIREVCSFRGWALHALNVRTTMFISWSPLRGFVRSR
jgi:hypothetical protein